MKFCFFAHSLISDWNHGNAHFLRGIVSELLGRGHEVDVYEPEDAWSVTNLVAENGALAIKAFHAAYPSLRSVRYRPDTLNLERAVHGADVVIVHEWNDHNLVREIGAARKANPKFRLFFHDTHHRAVTARAEMAGYSLEHYDGVLAYGEVLRRVYLDEGWTRNAWTWHEAADVRVFRPMREVPRTGDLVWIGNWGDEERSAELHEFLIEPVRALNLRAKVYGVRYPADARKALAAAGIAYCGWLPNFRVPEVFAGHRVTVHVPRRPYVKALPGIPTIRPFEALACGIPLVSAPWHDEESLFTPGEDFLCARDGSEMVRHLQSLLEHPARAQAVAARGLNTIAQRHTCAHRVDELLGICESLDRQ
jgi:spore maturation protein CgeB